jgi:hypothetical protein
LKGNATANFKPANVESTADTVRTDMSAATNWANMATSTSTARAHMNPAANRAVLSVINVWHWRSKATKEMSVF